MQSREYVPALSGLRLDEATGAMELNSGCTGQFNVPRLITVEVGDWAESELPTNAIERYRFIGDQVMAIPAEYRDGAEFSTTDESYDRDCVDIRTRLIYKRPETAAEMAERLAERPSASTLVVFGDRVEISAGGHVMFVMAAEPPFVLHADTCLINDRLIAGSQPDR